MTYDEAAALKARIEEDHPLLSVSGPNRYRLGGEQRFDLLVTDPASRKQESVLALDDYERGFWFFLSEINDPQWREWLQRGSEKRSAALS